MRQGGCAERFEEDGLGPTFGRRLNRFEDLIALLDGVIVRVDNLEVETETVRGFLRGGSLLQLIIVVVGGKRKKELEFRHRIAVIAPRRKDYTEIVKQRAKSAWGVADA